MANWLENLVYFQELTAIKNLDEKAHLDKIKQMHNFIKIVVKQSYDKTDEEANRLIKTASTNYLIFVIKYFNRFDEKNERFKSFQAILHVLTECFDIISDGNELLHMFGAKLFEFLEDSISNKLKHEIIIFFNLLIGKFGCNDDLYKKFRSKLVKLIDDLETCGDYSQQESSLKLILLLCPDVDIVEIAKTFFPERKEFAKAFSKINKRLFEIESRRFLNLINNVNNTVKSVIAATAYLGERCIFPHEDFDGNLWVDFNFGTSRIYLDCSAKCLMKNPEDGEDDYERIDVTDENVSSLTTSYEEESKCVMLIVKLKSSVDLQMISQSEFVSSATILQIIFNNEMSENDLEECLLKVFPNYFASLNQSPSGKSKSELEFDFNREYVLGRIPRSKVPDCRHYLGGSNVDSEDYQSLKEFSTENQYHTCPDTSEDLKYDLVKFTSSIETLERNTTKGTKAKSFSNGSVISENEEIILPSNSEAKDLYTIKSRTQEKVGQLEISKTQDIYLYEGSNYIEELSGSVSSNTNMENDLVQFVRENSKTNQSISDDKNNFPSQSSLANNVGVYQKESPTMENRKLEIQAQERKTNKDDKENNPNLIIVASQQLILKDTHYENASAEMYSKKIKTRKGNNKKTILKENKSKVMDVMNKTNSKLGNFKKISIKNFETYPVLTPKINKAKDMIKGKKKPKKKETAKQLGKKVTLKEHEENNSQKASVEKELDPSDINNEFQNNAPESSIINQKKRINEKLIKKRFVNLTPLNVKNNESKIIYEHTDTDSDSDDNKIISKRPQRITRKKIFKNTNDLQMNQPSTKNKKNVIDVTDNKKTQVDSDDEPIMKVIEKGKNSKLSLTKHTSKLSCISSEIPSQEKIKISDKRNNVSELKAFLPNLPKKDERKNKLGLTKHQSNFSFISSEINSQKKKLVLNMNDTNDGDGKAHKDPPPEATSGDNKITENIDKTKRKPKLDNVEKSKFNINAINNNTNTEVKISANDEESENESLNQTSLKSQSDIVSYDDDKSDFIKPRRLNKKNLFSSDSEDMIEGPTEITAKNVDSDIILKTKKGSKRFESSTQTLSQDKKNLSSVTDLPSNTKENIDVDKKKTRNKLKRTEIEDSSQKNNYEFENSGSGEMKLKPLKKDKANKFLGIIRHRDTENWITKSNHSITDKTKNIHSNENHLKKSELTIDKDEETNVEQLMPELQEDYDEDHFNKLESVTSGHKNKKYISNGSQKNLLNDKLQTEKDFDEIIDDHKSNTNKSSVYYDEDDNIHWKDLNTTKGKNVKKGIKVLENILISKGNTIAETVTNGKEGVRKDYLKDKTDSESSKNQGHSKSKIVDLSKTGSSKKRKLYTEGSTRFDSILAEDSKTVDLSKTGFSKKRKLYTEGSTRFDSILAEDSKTVDLSKTGSSKKRKLYTEDSTRFDSILAEDSLYKRRNSTPKRKNSKESSRNIFTKKGNNEPDDPEFLILANVSKHVETMNDYISWMNKSVISQSEVKKRKPAQNFQDSTVNFSKIYGNNKSNEGVKAIRQYLIDLKESYKLMKMSSRKHHEAKKRFKERLQNFKKLQ